MGASLDQLPSDVSHRGRCEWDALAGAHPDAMADALHPDLPDVAAERSVDRERDAPARDGSRWADSQSADPAEPAVPCKPDAGQSAEQSCAVPASVDARARSAVPLQPVAGAELEAQSARSEAPELKH